MNLNDYCEPVSLENPGEKFVFDPDLFCKNIYIHTPDNPIKNIDQFNVAIIGVPETRDNPRGDTKASPDMVRNNLYQLTKLNKKLKIIDCGNLITTGTVADTYFALRDVVSNLLEYEIIPVVVGGGKNLTYPLYQALEGIRDKIRVVTVDADIPFTKSISMEERYFLDRILVQEKHNLYNFTNIGYQSCFVSKEVLDDLGKYKFDAVRIGIARNDFKETEPEMRDADIVSISMQSVKQSDSPAHFDPSPNGFYSEEICQLARYAGLGNKQSVFGVFDLHPDFDLNQMSCKLAAQVIWYFLEAVSLRKNELIDQQMSEFKKFIVNHDEAGHELVFFKNIKSGRWWLEIPGMKDDQKSSPVLVACSEDDYNKACQHEIPDRWWKNFQKLN